jgi:uncharacterized protein
MISKIYVNIPVKNLDKSIAFFTKMGYPFNPKFTDDKAGCLVISEHIYAMLLTEPFFKGFTNKEVCDTSKSAEAIISLSADSKDEVNDLVNKAKAAGATTPIDPVTHGDYMYQWGFQDLDGHQWELFYMDETKFPAQ